VQEYLEYELSAALQRWFNEQTKRSTAFPKRPPAYAPRERASSAGSSGRGMEVKGGPNRMWDCAAHHVVLCVPMVQSRNFTGTSKRGRTTKRKKERKNSWMKEGMRENAERNEERANDREKGMNEWMNEWINK